MIRAHFTLNGLDLAQKKIVDQTKFIIHGPQSFQFFHLNSVTPPDPITVGIDNLQIDSPGNLLIIFK
jgi:hypothetical protein